MEFFRIRKDIPFMRFALVFNLISVATFVIAVGALAIKGLNLGVEFTGGTVMEVNYSGPADITSIRETLNEIELADAVVQVDTSVWMYAYEASRPDAEVDDQGVVTSRACSRAGVLPWTSVNLAEALAACRAADMELCTDTEWQAACEVGASCGWSYTPAAGSCDDYETDGSTACNGHDVNATPGGADNDAVAATGTATECFADHTDGPVYDLSGNVISIGMPDIFSFFAAHPKTR